MKVTYSNLVERLYNYINECLDKMSQNLQEKGSYNSQSASQLAQALHTLGKEARAKIKDPTPDDSLSSEDIIAEVARSLSVEDLEEALKIKKLEGDSDVE